MLNRSVSAETQIIEGMFHYYSNSQNHCWQGYSVVVEQGNLLSALKSFDLHVKNIKNMSRRSQVRCHENRGFFVLYWLA